MYLEKSKSFDDAFEHDMSGLTLNAKGENLDTLEVVEIKEASPAYNAGLRNGDTIIKMNGRNLYNSKLSEIVGMLRKREGMRVKCKYLRNGQIIQTKFHLKRMI